MKAGRTVLFRKEDAKNTLGLRVSPVGVLEENEKLWVIHDLTKQVGERRAAGECDYFL